MSGQKIGRIRSKENKTYCPKCGELMKPIKWMGSQKKGMYWQCLKCDYERKK